MSAARLSALLRDDPVLPNVPAPVREVVSKCLRKNVADRYANMNEVRDAIANAAQSMHNPAGDLPTQAIVSGSGSVTDQDDR